MLVFENSIGISGRRLHHSEGFYSNERLKLKAFDVIRRSLIHQMMPDDPGANSGSGEDSVQDLQLRYGKSQMVGAEDQSLEEIAEMDQESVISS